MQINNEALVLISKFIVKFNNKSVVRTELIKLLSSSKISYLNNAENYTIELVELQGKIENKVKNTLDIKNLDIPYIEFTGDESELASVFQNLNTGERKLTKYQAFAAQWSNYEILLSNKE